MANFTKQAIKASFIKLLNEKPLNKISVRDIVEDCGINRNSFYYHFQDIPSLISEIVTELTDSIINRYPSINSLSECFQAAFEIALENRRAIMHIYDSANRDIFTTGAMQLCESVVTTYISTAFPDAPLEESDAKVLIKFLKCEIYGMCIDWVTSGMHDDALDDLKHIIDLCQGFPELILERSRKTDITP